MCLCVLADLQCDCVFGGGVSKRNCYGSMATAIAEERVGNGLSVTVSALDLHQSEMDRARRNWI